MTERVLTAPAEPITVPVRSTVVDIVKGLAITLVVLGHTAQGMVHRQWWTGPSARLSDLFIYSFHMPAFFFVAGLFLAGSLRRRGPIPFITDKLKTILYPYVLWVVISELIEPLIGRFKMGSPPFVWKAFILSVLGGDFNWFLPVLFFCQLLALCTWKLPNWLRLSLALAAAMTMTEYGPVIVYRTVREFCFLAAGMLIGRMIFKLAKVPLWAAALGAGLIFALQWEVVLRDGENAQFGLSHQWLAVILGLTGTAGLLLLGRLMDGTRIGTMWAWVGEGSLAIFLLSAFAQGAAREALLRGAHTHELWLQLLLPSLFAVVIPAVMWHQQERWRIGWFFHWPSRRAG